MKSKYADRYRKIGRTIAYYRSLRGLSQEAFADKIGISKSYLSKIEAPSSQKPYSLDVLFAIADGLEIDVIQLLQPSDSKENK